MQLTPSRKVWYNSCRCGIREGAANRLLFSCSSSWKVSEHLCDHIGLGFGDRQDAEVVECLCVCRAPWNAAVVLLGLVGMRDGLDCIDEPLLAGLGVFRRMVEELSGTVPG